MMHRLIASTLFLLLLCATCLGQTSFQGLTPGTSTGNDVPKVLGQPVRQINPALSEYKPPAGIAKVEVEFANAAQPQIVKRIEVYFLRPISRPALIKKFSLPERANSNATSAEGKLVEYFDAPALMVFTYASSDVSSGVVHIGYYSSDSYDIAVATAPSAPQKPSAKAGGLANTSLPPEMLPPSGGYSSSVGRTGGPPVTVTTRPDDGRTQPANPDSDNEEREITLSAEELQRLVGRYEFIQTDEPGLKFAMVARVAERLQLTMGKASYTLVPIAGDDFVVANSDAVKKSDAVNFKVAGKPGVKVGFLFSGDKVENLFIVEEQSEPIRFSVAVPKP